MAPSQVKIRKFDPRTIPDDATVVFIGARGSGKSTAVRDVLYHHRHIPSGIAMSGTERYTNYWSSIIPRSFIFDEFSEEALASTMKHQQRLAPPGRPRDPAFVLCDDVMYSKELGTNKKVREVFMNGRHCNLLFLLSLQYAMDLPPALRSNIDFVVAFREPIVENRKKLYLNFFGQVPDFHTFETILHSCTANHEALVVNNKIKGADWQESLFYYKAPLREGAQDWRMGSPAMWKWHFEHHDPSAGAGDDDEEGAGGRGKKGKRVAVKKY